MKDSLYITGVIIALLAACVLAFYPLDAGADTTVTPVASAMGRATDNSGQRTGVQGRRQDVLTTLSAGGRIDWSRPTFAIRISALGEYERYLSAAARNTYASGGLDGKWRTDERTTVRSDLTASYAPDRYDPRVPYRVAIAAPEGTEIPPFVRATTTRAHAGLRWERWLTETDRLRLFSGASSVRYTDRRLVGPQPSALPPRSLESRAVFELGGEGLRQITEAGAAGFYTTGAGADYETGPNVFTAESGVMTEWNVTERWTATARSGMTYTTVPGDRLPDRLGWGYEGVLTRLWTRGQLDASVKEGVHLTTGAIPAAHRREGRLAAQIRPFERLSADGWVAAARERSMFSAYHATGTFTQWNAGAALGFRATERTTVKLGYEHTRLDSSGLVELPFRSNVVFLGITFAGGGFGDPPANP